MKWNSTIEKLFRNKKNHTANCDNSNFSTANTGTSVVGQNRIPIEFNLKILVITDEHGCLDGSELIGKDADVCLLLGDLSPQDIMLIKENITSMPIYGVLGNHDSFELYDRYGIENIHGKVVEINGVKIAGMQGSIRYKNSDFPLYTDEESCEIADQIGPADILISHDSPKFFHGDNDFAHSGLQGITHYCEKHHVPLNIHGHHHWGKSGILENGTLSMCCYGVALIDTATLK